MLHPIYFSQHTHTHPYTSTYIYTSTNSTGKVSVSPTSLIEWHLGFSSKCRALGNILQVEVVISQHWEYLLSCSMQPPDRPEQEYMTERLTDISLRLEWH